MTRNEIIFIQTLMHKGIVNDHMMTQLCNDIFGNEQQDIKYYITKVNKKFEDLGMGIKAATCELTGEKYWLFTSTVVSDLANFNYDYKPFLEFNKVELKYLNKIFEKIIGSDDGFISSINCINIVGEVDEQFTRTQADEFLKKIIQKMWLSLKDGQIYMGVRSILEFMPLFKEKFKDHLDNCFLCKVTVFSGEYCPSCNVKFHTYCLAKISKHTDNPKCLNCKNYVNIPNSSVIESSMDVDKQPESRTSKRTIRKAKS